MEEVKSKVPQQFFPDSTRLELLARREVGDDVERQYVAWFGAERFRVLVTLGPQGKLTALRISPEQP
jgi:hypothetical protein